MNKKEKLKVIMERVKQIDKELIRLEREIKRWIMFGTEEQKKMLELIIQRNESIKSLRQSVCEGMKKLDEQSDDLLKKLMKLRKIGDWNELWNIKIK